MKTIYSAFVKAQKAFGPALKTSTNPHFRSKYADLSACVEAVIDALNDNGIGLIQTVHECNNGALVETIFIHESGESLSCGKLHVPATKQDAHGFGSALTYARRYSLLTATGLAPEDDDVLELNIPAMAPQAPPIQALAPEPEDDDLETFALVISKDNYADQTIFNVVLTFDWYSIDIGI
jgi:hypothetical protein